MSYEFTREIRSRPNPEDTPLRSLHYAISFSGRDWSLDRADAWIYGVVIGWGSSALSEISHRFNWDDLTLSRLAKLRARYEAMEKVTVEGGNDPDRIAKAVALLKDATVTLAANLPQANPVTLEHPEGNLLPALKRMEEATLLLQAAGVL